MMTDYPQSAVANLPFRGVGSTFKDVNLNFSSSVVAAFCRWAWDESVDGYSDLIVKVVDDGWGCLDVLVVEQGNCFYKKMVGVPKTYSYALVFVSMFIRYKLVDTLVGKRLVLRSRFIPIQDESNENRDAFTLFMLIIWLDMRTDVELGCCYQFDEGLEKIFLPSFEGGYGFFVPYSFLNQLLSTFFLKNFIPINFVLLQEDSCFLSNHVNSAELTGCVDILHKLFLGVPEPEGIVYSRLSKRNFRFAGKFNGQMVVYPGCFPHLLCDVRRGWLVPMINSCRVKRIRLFQIPSVIGRFQDLSLVFNIDGLPKREFFRFSICDRLEGTLCYSDWIDVPEEVPMYGTGKRGRRIKNWEEDPVISFSIDGTGVNYLMIELECDLVFKNSFNYTYVPGLQDGFYYLPLDNTKCVGGMKFLGECFMKSVMKQRVDNHPGLKG